VSANVLLLIGGFAKAHGLGNVYGQDTGFRIRSDPDTVRAPDGAFLARDRVALVRQQGYASIVPNLVVEVLSPGDRPSQVLERIADWLDAGVTLIWVVDPRREEVRVHRADGSVALRAASEELSGEDVLPGFSCSVGEFFV